MNKCKVIGDHGRLAKDAEIQTFHGGIIKNYDHVREPHIIFYL